MHCGSGRMGGSRRGGMMMLSQEGKGRSEQHQDGRYTTSTVTTFVRTEERLSEQRTRKSQFLVKHGALKRVWSWPVQIRKAKVSIIRGIGPPVAQPTRVEGSSAALRVNDGHLSLLRTACAPRSCRSLARGQRKRGRCSSEQHAAWRAN